VVAVVTAIGLAGGTIIYLPYQAAQQGTRRVSRYAWDSNLLQATRLPSLSRLFAFPFVAADASATRIF